METHRAALRPLGAMPRHELAEHVAGQAIIGLPVAAQPAANRTEADDSAARDLAGSGQEMVGPVHFRADGGLHVFPALAFESACPLDAGAVQNAFDRPVGVANFVQHGGHGRAVGHVALVVRGRYARVGKSLQRAVPLDEFLDALPGAVGGLAGLAARRS